MADYPAITAGSAAGAGGGTRTALGWPAARHHDPAPHRALGWPLASRVEPASADPASNGHVSRETIGGPTSPAVTAESTATAESTGTVASAWPTAGELAESPDAAAVGAQDRDTPLAVATEEEVRRVTPHRRLVLDPPAHTRTLVVANQKGGVGKTTTAVNIAAALAQGGLKVLVVDLDPQGNASTALGIAHQEGTPGAYQALIEDRPMADLVQPCMDLPGLMVLPASIDLAGAEIDLVSLVARESRLRRTLSAYLAERAAAGDALDYVFIDCPPSLGLLTVNALVAGEEILLPIQCEYYALEGVTQLLRTVDMVRAHLNPVLHVSTIVLTMHDARTRLSAGVADEVRKHFPDQVLRSAIPRSVRISEAPSYQQTVMTYDPSSPGALSYLEAAREISVRGAAEPAAGSADDDEVAVRGPAPPEDSRPSGARSVEAAVQTGGRR